MSRQFSHADRAVLVVTGYAEVFTPDMITESFIQAVIAREDLGCFRRTVNAMCLAARYDPYSPFLPGNRAGQFAYQFYGCIWRGLFVICLTNSQDIAGILYQSMLKTTSRPDERHPSLTRKADRA
jgi:hypothetical protein